ncbi:coiled-coil and C2 domain-containing protein 1-like isoform X1 [Bactrocera dorsalis]|uniref:Coiled-coil and C2 domain-containing protein 1-like isoform X1 n=2 Tax=Bactrocera dorsalis TaxID=27457 RepID=A0A6I9VUN6_BACDO|nr:coiled-coil and C2 domain-containing protein 1-like isoform X1 [Bactrocera dorsalis]
MFLRKKSETNKRRTQDLSQFGLTEIPDDFDPAGGYVEMDENDSDLENELAEITNGTSKIHKPKIKRGQTNDLDKMVAESMRDIDSEDENDADLENDTELLSELNNISELEKCVDLVPESQLPDTTVSAPNGEQDTFLPTTSSDIFQLIQQRILMYKLAETSAKEAGESAKVRRFGRALKTLLELQQAVNKGKEVKLEDIPPEVNVKPLTQKDDDSTNREPSRPAPPPPFIKSDIGKDSISPPEMPLNEKSDKTINLNKMRERQHQYKTAALQAKHNGDTSLAIQYLKVVKKFDMVIKMAEDGQEVDLSDMPPSPDQFLDFLSKLQKQSEEGNKELPTLRESCENPDNIGIKDISSVSLTMEEALQQRLDKYKSVQDLANAEGNSSKARRFGRIVKQYEDAIKLYKAGKPVAYEELPVPPGFSPLPSERASAINSDDPVDTVVPKHSEAPNGETNSNTGSSEKTPTSLTAQTSPQKHDLTTRTSGNQQKNNLAEQQMKVLLERQAEFKIAAIEAKKAGEIDQAKEYLKIYKGFDALLNAASSGLPVDLTSLPLPPSQRDNLEASFAIVSTEECDPENELSDIGIRIEEQLAKQLMMCKNTRDHHKAMGDVAGMNRFENLALTVQKDLDLVRYSKHKNLSLPKFHYEKRSFNIVHCNTDLSDNELEIIVVRGLNYNVPNPKDVDTYVKIEFPLVNDETFKAKTSVIKNNDSPDYDQHFQIEINRGNRQFQRIFKRHHVKFEVYSRGIDCRGLSRILPMCCFRGFLRSDILIGTVNVKLQPIETKCDIHDTFNLMDGRKAVGGKLEVKLRVRNPILTKQVEHIEEKWLVVDS